MVSGWACHFLPRNLKNHIPSHPPPPHLQTVKLRLFADQSGTSHLPDCWDMRWVGKCPREPLFKHCCCRDLGILQAASFSVRALVLSCPEGPYPGSGGGGGGGGGHWGLFRQNPIKRKQETLETLVQGRDMPCLRPKRYLSRLSCMG